jgi:hypothetical protein
VREKTQHRTDVDDSPIALLPHSRQDGVRHAQHAEEIGFKLLPGFRHTGFFQRSHEMITGVVDQVLNRPGLLHNALNRRVHAGVIRHLHLDDFNARNGAGGLRVAHRAEHTRSSLRQQLRDLPTDTGSHSGD